VNFRKCFLDVHVGESNGGNYAIETLILEWQAFTRALHISSVWKSHPSSSQTAVIDVKSCNLIRRGDPHEARSRPDPQPKSRTRINHAPRLSHDFRFGCRADGIIWQIVFNSLHQKNRPGLLLLNGVLYLGFGSNYCNDANSGWVLSYDATTLSQLAVFNASPDQGLASIWQAGNGLAADEAGNILVETAEAGNNGYDIQNGGQTYCNSVVKLAPNLTVADYFTPWNVAYLNTYDFDLSSTGVLVLPDQQDSPYPHELIASGKQGIVYVLNRDQMGMYQLNDGGKIQEFPLVPGATYDVQFGSPAYWNNTVYFAPNASPLMAFPLSGGLFGTPLKVGKYPGSHSPSISANGNTNGILWVIESGAQLLAFDAVSLKVVYTTNHGNPVLYTSSALRYHHHHRHRHQSSQPRRLYRNQPVVSSMCGRGRPRPRHRARRIQCHPAKPI